MIKSHSTRKAWHNWIGYIFAVMLQPASGIAEEPASVDDASMIVPIGEAFTYWPHWRGYSGQG